MPFPDALAAVRAVDGHGRGHQAAQQAWPCLAQADISRLPEILAAMDDSGPIATNWLRAAVDTVAERALKGGQTFSLDSLEEFLCDRSHGPRPRRLAFEWILRIKPDRREFLLRDMLDDPSLELRYDAVAALMAQARPAEDPPKAIAIYRNALDAARDIGQINACADALKQLGQPVDLVEHLGLITTWHLIGPFDNSNESGFDVAYPPEQGIDLAAKYHGKLGEVAWQHKRSDHPNGLVDINQCFGDYQGSIVYATADFYVADPQSAQIRLASYNATKVWLNGKQIDANEVYHTAMFLDQYISQVQLRPGRNVILLKVCQNEQTEDWARNWNFQLRVTDLLGKAIHSDTPDSR